MAAAVSLLFSVVALARTRGGRRRRSAGSPATDAGSADEIDALANRLSAVALRVEAAEAHGRRSMQGVGVVRFNPFPDTGGNQSFVLAMVDAQGDGFVLSSLHSRAQTRVYLKQLSNGKAETALSTEESEAIRRAVGA